MSHASFMGTFELDSILAEVELALSASDPARAFERLAPLASELEHDRQLAYVWLTLLRISPGRAGLQEDVSRILSHWPEDAELALLGCDALIRAAERQAPDVPPGEDGPAWQAAELAARSWQRLGTAARDDAAVGGYWLMNRANALRLAHRYPEAESAYAEALALDPNNGDWWFNKGLLHKAQGDFERGLAAAQRARELARSRPDPAQRGQSSEGRGVLWNIALCATALGRGEIAVEALQKLGFAARVLPGGMPHVDDLPPLQLRAATLGSGHGFGGAELDRAVAFEVVWVSPASPCHGVVQTPTFREASIDYGDVVLWDGTPVGVAEHESKPVPRFPLLSRLRAGDERRLRFVALEQAQGDVQKLGGELPQGALLFVHRARVEMLCARCASGEHTRHHPHTAAEPHRLVYGKIVLPAAADLAGFRRELDALLSHHSGVQLVMPGLFEALGDAPAAGKAHQIWRGLERSALKSDSAVAVPRA